MIGSARQQICTSSTSGKTGAINVNGRQQQCKEVGASPAQLMMVVIVIITPSGRDMGTPHGRL